MSRMPHAHHTTMEHEHRYRGPEQFGKTDILDAVQHEVKQHYSQHAEIPCAIECWTCGDTVQLDMNDLDWPVGRHNFFVPNILSYHCARCDEVYFPDAILDIVSAHVEEAFRKRQETTKGSPAPPSRADVIAFNRLPRLAEIG